MTIFFHISFMQEVSESLGRKWKPLENCELHLALIGRSKNVPRRSFYWPLLVRLLRGLPSDKAWSLSSPSPSSWIPWTYCDLLLLLFPLALFFFLPIPMILSLCLAMRKTSSLTNCCWKCLDLTENETKVRFKCDIQLWEPKKRREIESFMQKKLDANGDIANILCTRKSQWFICDIKA